MSTRLVTTRKPTILKKLYDPPDGVPYVSEDYFIVGFRFKHQFIGKLLSLNRIRAIRADTPLAIISPTGSGKSTFVLSTIRTVVKERGGRILILVSRTVLALQYKRQAASLECPERLEQLTDIGLMETDTFGIIDVYTYHKFYQCLKNNPDLAKSYTDIVLDEFHFFLQDAPFNKYTGSLLDLIFKHFRHCRRYYLSATPDGILDIIINKERELLYSTMNRILCLQGTQNYLNHPVFTIYHFECDYDYINPILFTDDTEILEHIKADMNSKEKYLIFVDTKQRGIQLQRQLGDEMAEYIDAELKNTTKKDTVQEIVRSESFSKKALIATSFLDVGVNITDCAVKNVVIYSSNKIHFLQCTGRRRKGGDSSINLFICIPSKSDLETMLKRINLEIHNMGEAGLVLSGYREEVTDPYYVCNEHGKIVIKYNPLYSNYLEYRKEELLMLLGCFDEIDENTPEQAAIARHYLSWLKLEEKYNNCIWLGQEPEGKAKEIQDYFYPALDQELSEDDFHELINDFIPLYNQPGNVRDYMRKDRDYGTRAINNIFEKYKLLLKFEKDPETVTIRLRRY